MARHTQLASDAAPVPDGYQPRRGVEYGCGDCTCTRCYEPIGVPIRCYRVTSLHTDDSSGIDLCHEQSGIYDATSADEARTMAERAAAGVEDIEIIKVECLD